MPVIPIHKAVQQSDFGVFLKEVSPASPKQTIEYAHQDDYYIFGLVNNGSCCVSIDFKDYLLSEGEMICTQPGQVHRVINSTNTKAFLLFADSVFIDSSDKQTLAEYALCPTPFRMNEPQLSELKQVLALITRRISNWESDASKRIVQNLSRAAIGIITEAIRSIIQRQPKSKRHIEITLAFKELLSKEHPIDRSPSHYAELLHISPVYLNEAIKDITGVSVSKYIQNELILKAKRMLVYTSRNIKEIALDSGFDDYAYFTRLFTKTTGISPSLYRKKYLE